MSQYIARLNPWLLPWVTVCLCITAYALRLLYNVFFHPLASFPGPTLAGMTRWYETFFDLRGPEGGQYVFQIRRMHEKYGPIVRIAPNELHIDDPRFREVLFGSSQKRDKVPYMTEIFGTPLAIFGTISHEMHRLRRSALNPYFSKQSIQRVEGLISKKVQKMGDRICSDRGKTIHLRHVLTACIVDVTTEFSFAKCANALDGAAYSPEWEDMMVGVSEAVPIARAFPGIVQVVQMLPVWVVRLVNPLMARFAEFEQLIRSDVEETFRQHADSSGRVTKTNDAGHATIFQEILNSPLPNHEKTVDRMTQEALSVISAASETTSSVLATVIFYVVQDPAIESRLIQELRTMMPTPSSQARWKDLEKLPFLSAVIKEGLRVTVPVAGRLALVARDVLPFETWTIPAGTYVSMSLRDALHHPEIYTNPRSFNPDRWLHASEPSAKSPEVRTRQQDMQMAFVPFSRGSRMCIGTHLAYANMYLILATLLRRFEMQIVDTVRERDVEFVRDYFISKPSRSGKGVSIRVIRERTK